MSNAKKVALITGSNRGIGFETARQLGEKGVAVIVTARSRGDVDETVKALRDQGFDAEGAVLDITRSEDRKAAVEFVASKFGKLDILINNAGAAPAEGIFGSNASETTEAELQTVFNVNLFSVIALTREFLPLIRKSDAGKIVNISSILGSQTIHASQPSPIAQMRRFSYNASKSALNMFTIHLAAELKDTKIKVNSVHPGWVKTALGSQAAPMSAPDGAKTSVAVALLGPDGPTGRFIHEIDKQMPW